LRTGADQRYQEFTDASYQERARAAVAVVFAVANVPG
jgi:hypothetical protein